MAERSQATVISVGGPVLKAEAARGHFSMNEAVSVGRSGLLGEVLRIDGPVLTIQIYEDTTGLRPGDPVAGTGGPLAVRLGPGLLGGIYDGLLRPLGSLKGQHVRPGDRPDDPRDFDFSPALETGAMLTGGELLGTARDQAGREHRCLVPPDAQGRVVRVVGPGRCNDRDAVVEVETANGGIVPVALSHRWPVRTPRPVAARLPLREPLFTGQRIIDILFPVARGGKAAMPGGFGTGKTILQQNLAKWCDADVIIYIGCGERGNEMTSVLEEFPALEDPRTGRPLLERTVIIANTSNMPVAAREASIYTGVTVAEYYRDQGLHAALFADSTSRWAEALREISGRLGELPAEGGYPAYLGSRKAEFYERAARVRTLAGDKGSVTVIGAVSPPGGDFSEPVTLHTQRHVSCFWPLDRDRARARFFPAIHPLTAYSEYTDVLAGWWRRAGDPDWPRRRRRFLNLLEEQATLERMARIVGKDALPPAQQLVLLAAELLNESLLRQNAFSEIDRFASAGRQIAMMRVFDRFLDCADQALKAGAEVEQIAGLSVLRRLRRMGEDMGDDQIPAGFDALKSELERSLHDLGGVAEAAPDAAVTA